MTTSDLLQLNVKQFFPTPVLQSMQSLNRSMIACLVGSIRYSEFTREPKPIYEMRDTWRSENLCPFYSNTFLSILERCLLCF